jgi:outer membrane murein-binding lipoprotein Lpp
MTTGAWLAISALVVDVVLFAALVASRRTTERLQARVRALETRLDDDLAPAVDAARRDAATAVSTARRATVAVGVEDPPPRLPFETLTAPVVRAVAIGAGARRALGRLARPRRAP